MLDARNAGGVPPALLVSFGPHRPARSVLLRPVDRGRASSGPGLSLSRSGADALVSTLPWALCSRESLARN